MNGAVPTDLAPVNISSTSSIPVQTFIQYFILVIVTVTPLGEDPNINVRPNMANKTTTHNDELSYKVYIFIIYWTAWATDTYYREIF